MGKDLTVPVAIVILSEAKDLAVPESAG